MKVNASVFEWANQAAASFTVFAVYDVRVCWW